MLEAITDETFEQEVLKSDLPVLLDFYADWCGPCKAQVPALEAVAATYEGKVKVMKLNIDDNGDTTQKFAVMSIPTLILFKGGEPAERLVGRQNERSLSAAIESVTGSQ